MKPVVLSLTAGSFIAGAAVTFVIIQAISMGSPQLSLIVGAVLGSQVGVIMHHRQPGAQPNVAAKAILGAVLAMCAIVVGVVLHETAAPFTFVEVTVPFAAVGSFFFPFVVFNTMWAGLSQKKPQSPPTDA